MMDVNQLYSGKRSGSTAPTNSSDTRTEFQRDFDRIIFSSAFRRLQNKTQVFPLPGSVFVHNRLTHSLEVASVGRSLGASVGEYIADHFADQLTSHSREFYKYSLYNVISSACLCHDIGNPAFGHSGEDAIASFFIKNESRLHPLFTEKEWSDLINFEGNANAIRILTQQQQGKSEGGLMLTYATLSSIAKYPCESIAKNRDFIHRKKFGFFQSEKAAFKDIARHTAMIQTSEEPAIYLRHPFVWLVEAADDICYHIIDLEDAHRLGIIDHHSCVDILKELIASFDRKETDKIQSRLKEITDKNDRVSYLRAKAIYFLTTQCAGIYKEHISDILEGRHSKPLFDIVSANNPALGEIHRFSVENIYNHRSVIEIENAGYNVMYELLSHFILPVIKEKDNRTKAEEKAIRLIPTQFLYEHQSIYSRVLGVIDYVSGMTDNYATDLYRKIKGIDIGMTL